MITKEKISNEIKKLNNYWNNRHVGDEIPAEMRLSFSKVHQLIKEFIIMNGEINKSLTAYNYRIIGKPIMKSDGRILKKKWFPSIWINKNKLVEIKELKLETATNNIKLISNKNTSFYFNKDTNDLLFQNFKEFGKYSEILGLMNEIICLQNIVSQSQMN